jgi:hypothetical protein
MLIGNIICGNFILFCDSSIAALIQILNLISGVYFTSAISRLGTSRHLSRLDIKHSTESNMLLFLVLLLLLLMVLHWVILRVAIFGMSCCRRATSTNPACTRSSSGQIIWILSAIQIHGNLAARSYDSILDSIIIATTPTKNSHTSTCLRRSASAAVALVFLMILSLLLMSIVIVFINHFDKFILVKEA